MRIIRLETYILKAYLRKLLVKRNAVIRNMQRSKGLIAKELLKTLSK